jgi:hypothetical protein
MSSSSSILESGYPLQGVLSENQLLCREFARGRKSSGGENLEAEGGAGYT